MSASRAKNIQLTIVATIIPLGVWGGIEIKKRYEQTIGRELTDEERRSSYNDLSISKAESKIRKLEKEKSLLEAESMAIIGKRERAIHMYGTGNEKSAEK
ncbi:hypothetical protein AYI68_g829 [Smittium mucronatum]|uniref:Uncharacterized protein n=1 Tax=Smittium mucronatum TaxID=133383 RepID=A0A1R0H6Z7_9FUNG|nr:hypothetical protein AYI68_g829 [Smittium mucronatum]